MQAKTFCPPSSALGALRPRCVEARNGLLANGLGFDDEKVREACDCIMRSLEQADVEIKVRSGGCAARLPKRVKGSRLATLAWVAFACFAEASTEDVFHDGFDCRGASGCGGATPICCASLTVSAGTPPSCPQIVSEGACTTAAACPTSLPNSCPATGQVQLCQASSECGNPSYQNCCEFPSGVTTATYCVDTFTALTANRCLP